MRTSATNPLDILYVVQVLLYKSEEDVMPTSMVTGRMDDYKKERGAQVLAQAGLTASQAIGSSASKTPRFFSPTRRQLRQLSASKSPLSLSIRFRVRQAQGSTT